MLPHTEPYWCDEPANLHVVYSPDVGRAAAGRESAVPAPRWPDAARAPIMTMLIWCHHPRYRTFKRRFDLSIEARTFRVVENSWQKVL
jgi:hypothetical protein